MHSFKQFLVPLVALLSMLGPLAIDTYLPSFPDMATAFQVSHADISQSLAIFLLAFGLGTLIWGPLMDRFGRLSSALVSLIGFGLASLVCAWAQDYQAFMLGRLLQGLLASGSMIAGHSMVRDLFAGAEAQKVMSKVMLLFAIAPGLAPIIGGWLHDLWGWRSVFIFLALYGFLAALALYWIGHETLEKTQAQSIHPKAIGRAYLNLVRHPSYLMAVLALSLTFGGLFIYIAGSANLIYDILQLGVHDFALFFLPVVGGMMLGSLVVSSWAHRLSLHRMIQLGLAAIILASVINLALESFVQTTSFTMIAPLVLYSFGMALIMPNLSLLAMDYFPNNRGTANAMRSFLQMGTNGLVAALIVPLVLGSAFYFALGLSVLCFVGVVFYWLSQQATKQLN